MLGGGPAERTQQARALVQLVESRWIEPHSRTAILYNITHDIQNWLKPTNTDNAALFSKPANTNNNNRYPVLCAHVLN